MRLVGSKQVHRSSPSFYNFNVIFSWVATWIYLQDLVFIFMKMRLRLDSLNFSLRSSLLKTPVPQVPPSPPFPRTEGTRSSLFYRCLFRTYQNLADRQTYFPHTSPHSVHSNQFPKARGMQMRGPKLLRKDVFSVTCCFCKLL